MKKASAGMTWVAIGSALTFFGFMHMSADEPPFGTAGTLLLFTGGLAACLCGLAVSLKRKPNE